MTLKIASLVSASLLAFVPAINAQQATASPAFAYASAVPVPSHTPSRTAISAPLDILEMVADHLDLSRDQKEQLETLLGKQHDLLTVLHQHADLSDQQKSAEFQQIRRQTKEQFVALLTPHQRHEFESMTR